MSLGTLDTLSNELIINIIEWAFTDNSCIGLVALCNVQHGHMDFTRQLSTRRSVSMSDLEPEEISGVQVAAKTFHSLSLASKAIQKLAVPAFWKQVDFEITTVSTMGIWWDYDEPGRDATSLLAKTPQMRNVAFVAPLTHRQSQAVRQCHGHPEVHVANVRIELQTKTRVGSREVRIGGRQTQRAARDLPYPVTDDIRERRRWVVDFLKTAEVIATGLTPRMARVLMFKMASYGADADKCSWIEKSWRGMSATLAGEAVRSGTWRMPLAGNLYSLSYLTLPPPDWTADEQMRMFNYPRAPTDDMLPPWLRPDGVVSLLEPIVLNSANFTLTPSARLADDSRLHQKLLEASDQGWPTCESDNDL